MNNERVEKNTIYLDEYIAKMVGGRIIDTHDEMRQYTNDTSYFCRRSTSHRNRI